MINMLNVMPSIKGTGMDNPGSEDLSAAEYGGKAFKGILLNKAVTSNIDETGAAVPSAADISMINPDSPLLPLSSVVDFSSSAQAIITPGMKDSGSQENLSFVNGKSIKGSGLQQNLSSGTGGQGVYLTGANTALTGLPQQMSGISKNQRAVDIVLKGMPDLKENAASLQQILVQTGGSIKPASGELKSSLNYTPASDHKADAFSVKAAGVNSSSGAGARAHNAVSYAKLKVPQIEINDPGMSAVKKYLYGDDKIKMNSVIQRSPVENFKSDDSDKGRVLKLKSDSSPVNHKIDPLVYASLMQKTKTFVSRLKKDSQ